MSNSVLYQNSDQQPEFTVLDTDGKTVLPANNFQNAQYRIFELNSCTVLLSKSLGNGISISGDNFVVTITDDEISFSGTKEHQFRVGTTTTELLAPIIDEPVDVIEACPAV